MNNNNQSDKLYKTDKERELLELVDGCYEVIELYKPQSPSQVAWKKNWLEKARKLGASSW